MKDVRDTPASVRDFIAALAAQGTVTTGPVAKAAAFAFRQKLYKWRQCAGRAAAPARDPAEAPDEITRRALARRAAETTADRAWIALAIHPFAAEKDWLDLTVFTVESVPGSDAWRVCGRKIAPVFGADFQPFEEE